MDISEIINLSEFISSDLVKVVGLGNAGCEVVKMIRNHSQGEFLTICFNSDKAYFESNPHDNHFLIGEELTNGMGCDSDRLLAKEVIKSNKDFILSIIGQADLVILVAGFGGGFGTVGVVQISKWLAQKGVSTLAIVSLPFDDESKDKVALAKRAFKKMHERSSKMLLLPLSKRFEHQTKLLSTAEMYQQANWEMTTMVLGISDIIFQAGVINLDIVDVKTILLSGVEVYHTYIEIDFAGKNNPDLLIEDMIQQVQHHFKQLGHKLSKSKSLLINIIGGEDLGLREINKIVSGINSFVKEDIEVILGTSLKSGFNNKRAVHVYSVHE